MKQTKTKNFCYLYRHIRLDTLVPFYIGIGSDLHFKRAFSKSSRNKHWNSIVAVIDYRVEILLKDLTWEEACKKEIQFIKIHGRSDLKLGTLCNWTNGGEGSFGVIMKQETKNKISKKKKGQNAGIPKSQEHNFKNSEAHKGIPRSEEAKQKMSKSHTGLHIGDKNIMFGKKHTEESKRKNRESNLGLHEGEKNHFFGKKHSEETKKIISEKKSEYHRLKKLAKLQAAS